MGPNPAINRTFASMARPLFPPNIAAAGAQRERRSSASLFKLGRYPSDGPAGRDAAEKSRNDNPTISPLPDICAGGEPSPFFWNGSHRLSWSFHVRSFRLSDRPALAGQAPRPLAALFLADAERRQSLDCARGDRAAL